MQSSVEVFGLCDEDLIESWPEVATILNKVLNRSNAAQGFAHDDILQAALKQTMQVWVVVIDASIKAVIVTEILIHPKNKVLSIPYVAGGQMNQWLDKAWHLLKRYARAHNCNQITAEGRKGWTRVLPEKPTYTIKWSIDL